jgi:hypothetical protein
MKIKRSEKSRAESIDIAPYAGGITEQASAVKFRGRGFLQ